MKKQLLATFLCVSLLFGTVSTVTAEGDVNNEQVQTEETINEDPSQAAESIETMQGSVPFPDVSPSDWFYYTVKDVYDLGVMTGKSNGYFDPYQIVTRAEMAVILYRMQGSPSTSASCSFPDTSSNVWYSQAINWANKTGIIKGYDNGWFGTNDPLTREQFMVMLYRYNSYIGEDVGYAADLSYYPDAWAISYFAWDAVRRGIGKGYIKGDSQGNINPLGSLKRAECATVLSRMYHIPSDGWYQNNSNGARLQLYGYTDQDYSDKKFTWHDVGVVGNRQEFSGTMIKTDRVNTYAVTSGGIQYTLKLTKNGSSITMVVVSASNSKYNGTYTRIGDVFDY
ncbi:MAG: S-layer homology domain-containing protein [Lachnospiraceae bacterium]|nr:S-layer homology domain-containing protein [Lachnospiraceae bacterium]MDD3616657.1 S-layer homology domain-containing protein [Lachnospiraceae bacterium]